MKTTLIIALMAISTTLFAQSITIYGKAVKGDGSRLKGTSTMKRYEDQLIITNYTGGSDHTATIEIEVPTAAYVADFRNMMTTATQPKPSIAAKPIIKNIANPGSAPIAAATGKITTQSLQTFPLSRLDISVTSRVGNNLPVVSRQVILENLIVESCTDIPASNTTKIKLKAIRIGWIYYSTDAKGNTTVTGKSGWDTAVGAAWTSF
ncbi:hypothetical protein [Chitinophaga parva]|nr:hypothetical protein [Chitinophaga parva]